MYKYTPIHLFTKFEAILITSQKEMNKFIKFHKINARPTDITHTGRALWITNEDNGASIFSIYIDKNRFDVGLIIHESVHVVQHLMECIGIKDYEFQAYMVEYLSTKIIDIMKNKKGVRYERSTRR